MGSGWIGASLPSTPSGLKAPVCAGGRLHAFFFFASRASNADFMSMSLISPSISGVNRFLKRVSADESKGAPLS
jgi:hypothetical protein